MLSEAQIKRVWEGMLEAEVGANYFADLSNRYYTKQPWGTLVCSSGAAVTALASLPDYPVVAACPGYRHRWIKRLFNGDAESTGLQYDERSLLKWERYVVEQHGLVLA